MTKPKICVVGLGYVGLPLAVEFGKISSITGLDINKKRIEQLKQGNDSSGEVSKAELKRSRISFTSDPKAISKADFIIVAVPTPVTKANVPDMSYLTSASKLVGQNLSKGSVVVFESTVYPGATEEVCVPIIEKYSGLKCGTGFKVGYSPERINPGDREHTISRIVKVVSGMDKKTLDRVADVYGTIIKPGVFRASSIKVAEAAKVIENIQRDLNIALMNELSLIFDRVGIPTKDVLDAAGTKWNFHTYHPGLVGGHCIGVDPYYLTYKAQMLGYQPQIILAGRAINEHMPRHVAELVIKGLSQTGKALNRSTVLLLGLTFKENVADYRNSKALDLISELKRFNIVVKACEPLLGDDVTEQVFGVQNLEFGKIQNSIDCVVMLAPHDEFRKITLKALRDVMGRHPLLIDVCSFFSAKDAVKMGFIYKSL